MSRAETVKASPSDTDGETEKAPSLASGLRRGRMLHGLEVEGPPSLCTSLCPSFLSPRLLSSLLAPVSSQVALVVVGQWAGYL
eukprot:1980174-Pyramimonas_sp.AAC.1